MSAAALLIKISADARGVKGGVDAAASELAKLQDRASGLGSKLVDLFPPSMATSAREVGSAVGALAGSFGGLGGAVAALGIGAAFNDFLKTTGALSDLSAQTDITTRDLQRFQYAGDLVGVSLDSIVGAVGQLQNRLGSGDKSAFAALDTLGLTFRDLQRLDPGQQFETIASAISKIRDPAQRAAVSMDLFGRAGVSLLPLLRSNLKDVGDEAVVLSDRIVEAGDRFGDVMTRATSFGKALIGNIFGPVVEWVDDTREAIEDLGRTFDTLRGKAEKLPEIQKAISFKAPPARDLTLPFEQAMRLSDDLDRQIERSIEKRVRQEQAANELLERSALSLVARVRDHAEAQFDNALAARRLTLNLLETVQAHRQLIPLVDTLTDSWLAARDAADAFNSQVRLGLDSAPGLRLDVKTLAGPFADVGKEGGKIAGLEFGRELSRTIIGAVQGGGDIGASIGAAIGSSIGNALGEKLAEAIGGKLGGALGGMLGPLGAIGGQLLGGVFDKIFGSAGRDLVKDFATASGGFDTLRAKLVPLGLEGERLWINLTQGVGKNNPQQAQAAIDAITAALGRSVAESQKLNPSFADVTRSAEAFGLKVTEIGDGINQMRVTENAQEWAQHWKILEAAGADMAEVAAGAADEFQTLVIESVKWGHKLPQEMRPILQKMVDMGLLTDDAGDKLTDLDKLNWDEPLEKSIGSLQDAMKELAQIIREDVGGALRGLPSPSLNLSGGGGGSSPSADVLAFPRGGAKANADRVNVFLDGNQVKTAMDVRMTRYRKVSAA